MENALLVGLSRQMSLSHELDVVANNIANIDTTGFKADKAAFSEFLMPHAADQQFPGSDRRVSFVQDRATWHDLAQGPTQLTNNPLDLVIDGDAFFVVQAQGGERAVGVDDVEVDASLLGGQVGGAIEEGGFKGWNAIDSPSGVGEFLGELGFGGSSGSVFIEEAATMRVVRGAVFGGEDGAGGR